MAKEQENTPTIPASSVAAAPAACPICHGPASEIFFNRAGHYVDQCENCGHTVIRDPQSCRDMFAIYETWEYFELNYNYQGIFDLADDGQWEGWVGHRLAQMDRHGVLAGYETPPAKVLEVGCLEGRVLYALKKRGHETYGCDINPVVCQKGREMLGLDIRVGELDQCGFAPGFFDVIYSFHTLEHLPDPREHLRRTLSLLRPGGTLFFEIPVNEVNYNHHDHLHFFTYASLDILMKEFFDRYDMEKNVFANGKGTKFESVLVKAILGKD